MLRKLYHKIKNKKVKELFPNQNKSIHELEVIQKNKLHRLLVHSYKNVPFYARIFKQLEESGYPIDDPQFFSKIPVLTRRSINEHRHLLISRDLKGNRLVPNQTSGSTGEALYLYYDQRSAAYRRASVVRNQQWINIHFFDRKAALWGASIDLKKTQSFKGNIISKLKNQIFLSSYDLSESSMAGYVQRLNRFKPKLLVSYPGPLSVFSEFLLTASLSVPSLEAIISSAETLYPWQREMIEKAFSCPVYNRYGCREFGDIAQECHKREGLHINADRFWVEIVDSDMNPVRNGDVGELLITDLDNYGMPLIRYRIGDMASMKNSPCSCGMSFPLLKNIEGRTLDVVQAPNGNKLGGTFWTILLKKRKSLQAFQLIQDSRTHLTINYVKSNSFHDSDLTYYEEKIHEKCGSNLEITFHEVSHIPLTSSGKSRIVISKI